MASRKDKKKAKQAARRTEVKKVRRGKEKNKVCLEFLLGKCRRDRFLPNEAMMEPVTLGNRRFAEHLPLLEAPVIS